MSASFLARRRGSGDDAKQVEEAKPTTVETAIDFIHYGIFRNAFTMFVWYLMLGFTLWGIPFGFIYNLSAGGIAVVGINKAISEMNR